MTTFDKVSWWVLGVPVVLIVAFVLLALEGNALRHHSAPAPLTRSQVHDFQCKSEYPKPAGC